MLQCTETCAADAPPTRFPDATISAEIRVARHGTNNDEWIEMDRIMLTTKNSPPQTIDVVIADDHPVVVAGIRKMLENVDDISVVATAGDVESLMRTLEKHPCDVLVCDFTFDSDGAQDGMRLMERLLKHFPKLRIILLTVHEDLLLVQHVLSLGVAGFIGKSSRTLETLPVAVRTVHSGSVYLDPEISGTLVNHLISRPPNGTAASGTETAISQALTKREFEVVRRLVKGMSVSDIARETHRSIKTVSTQKIRAMEKLGARNDIELGTRFRMLEGDER